MTSNNTYIKNGYICNYKKYEHVCLYCNKKFTSNKAKQKYCSRSCASKVTKNRSLHDCSIFNNGICDEITAYTLGLFRSDGSISCDRIVITSKDLEIIQPLHDIMTPNKKIYLQQGCYYIQSKNKEDLEFLKKHGFTNKKSYDVRLPIINKNLMNHLIRGWFDGDGCIYKSTTTNKKYNYKKTYNFVSFTSASPLFVEDLKNFLSSIGIHCTVSIDSRRKENLNKTYYIKIYKQEDVLKFKNYIYKNATIYIKRKYNRFKDIV